MKKNSFSMKTISLIISFLVISLTLFSCSKESSSKTTETESKSLSQSTKTSKNLQITKSNQADITVIKEFAESYEPKSTENAVIPFPPEPSEEVLRSISNLNEDKIQEYEKYIVLIFLRLYRFHVENFKQSYELGRENPLTQEFFRIIKSEDYKKAELMSSYLAENYVKENTELQKYDLIEKEMKRIEEANKKFEQ